MRLCRSNVLRSGVAYRDVNVALIPERMKVLALLPLIFTGLAACSSTGTPSSSDDFAPVSARSGGRRCRPNAPRVSESPADTVVAGEAPLVEARIRPTPLNPHYPIDELQRRVQGQVLSSFVVDTLGRVVPGSEIITRETERGFGDAVCAYLRTVHFVPLESDGRRVTLELRDQLTTFAITY
jgi:outer membrane biosynthesis protein TonB